MAKRFTDTEKWRKPWYRKLGSKWRDVWQFLVDNCDHAGFWKIDCDTLSYFVGSKINLLDIQKNFKGKIEIFGDEIFISKFIEFQYGNLNPKNRVHKSILDRVEKCKKLSPCQGASKGLASPLLAPMDMDMDMELVLEMEMEEELEKEKKHKKKPELSWEELKPEIFEKMTKLHGYYVPFMEIVWEQLLAYDENKPYKNRRLAASNWFSSTITFEKWNHYKPMHQVNNSPSLQELIKQAEQSERKK